MADQNHVLCFGGDLSIIGRTWHFSAWASHDTVSAADGIFSRSRFATVASASIALASCRQTDSGVAGKIGGETGGKDAGLFDGDNIGGSYLAFS